MKIPRSIRNFRRSALLLLCTLFAASLAAADGAAQTVLQRARLGNNVEDITFVNKGPLSNHIVTLDGFEVFGLPGRGSGNSHFRKLFDLRGLPIEIGPRGMAHVESEKLFVFQVPAQNTSLFFVDHRGRLQDTRTIQYPGGFVPIHLEGLTYIPADSPSFPDHLLMVAWDENLDCDDEQGSRLEVLTRQGEVVAEIFPAAPLRCAQLTGVEFFGPDRLLVTNFFDNTVWTLDSAGQVVAPPVAVSSAEAIDGVVRLDDGRVVIGDYMTGDLLYFDENLNRRPGDDRSRNIGVGLSAPPVGVAWNTDTNEHIVLTNVAALTRASIASVPTTLDSSAQIVDLHAAGFDFPGRLTYLPDEHLIALAHRFAPRAYLFFDGGGAHVDTVNAAIGFGAPSPVEYIPTTGQLAVRFAAPGEATRIRIVSRATGALVRTIDLSSTGLDVITGIAYFNPSHPSGGQFLLFGSIASDLALVTDFYGTPLGSFNFREKLGVLGPADISAITTGPQAGAFSSVEFDSSELVVFRLD